MLSTVSEVLNAMFSTDIMVLIDSLHLMPGSPQTVTLVFSALLHAQLNGLSCQDLHQSIIVVSAPTHRHTLPLTVTLPLLPSGRGWVGITLATRGRLHFLQRAGTIKEKKEEEYDWLC